MFCLFLFTPLFGQNTNLQGFWEGKLKLRGQELRMWLKIRTIDNSTFTASLDSPDQGVFDIQADSIVMVDTKVDFFISALSGAFSGTLQNDSSIVGEWSQAGLSWPVTFNRSHADPGYNRPQEPRPPFPYSEQDVYFKNSSKGIKLAGTLTLPKQQANMPAVVLISGSGPQDRNSSISGHKPFWVIADFLSRNGVAVLRFDDRGTGKSEGKFETATTFDFVDDANAALEFLKNHKGIQSDKIGIIGHSEGGLVVSMLAAKKKDLAFAILLAGPGTNGEQILYDQLKLILKANGASDRAIKKRLKLNRQIYAIAKSDLPFSEAKDEIVKLYKRKSWWMSKKRKEKESLTPYMANAVAIQVLSEWFRTFLIIEPADYIPKIHCPVLALNGSKDLQVPPDPNLIRIEEYLKSGGNKNFKCEKLEGLNHLFQHATSGSPNEYSTIEESFAPEALNEVLYFIQSACHLRVK